MKRCPWLHVPLVQMARTHTHMRLSAQNVLQGVQEFLTLPFQNSPSYLPGLSVRYDRGGCGAGRTYVRYVLKTLDLLADTAGVSMHVRYCRLVLGLECECGSLRMIV
jgi:hypothetical protein